MNVGDALGRSLSRTGSDGPEGRYLLRREIGEGGIARVFLADDQENKRSVALKVLRTEYLTQAETVGLFLAEPHAQQAVEHEGTIDIIDVVPEAAQPFFVTELVRGRTLSEELRHGRMALAAALHVARQVAAVLAHAHDVEVVHRNLKPQNVFLTSHRDDHHVVKLLELGATRMQSAGAKPIAGTLIGTPAYMAPEQLRQTAGGTRVDMYSFGVLLYELVAGERPFVGDVNEVVKRHLLEPAPRVQTRVPSAPAALDALIARCLEKDPDARPPSMHEVSLALATLEDAVGEGGAATAKDAWYAVPKNTSGYTTVPADATAAPTAHPADDDEPVFASVTGPRGPAASATLAPAPVTLPPPPTEPPEARPSEAPREPLFAMPDAAAMDAAPVRPPSIAPRALGAVVVVAVVVVAAIAVALGGDDGTAVARAGSDAGSPVPDHAIVPVPDTDASSDAGSKANPPAAGAPCRQCSVAFESTPAGAQVWIRMDRRIRMLCRAPCTFELPAGKEVLVELRMDGWRSAQETIVVGDGSAVRGTLRRR